MQHIRLAGKASAATVLCELTEEWHSGSTGGLDPGRVLGLNTDGDRVKTRWDDSLTLRVSHLSSRGLRLVSGEVANMNPFFFYQADLGPNACSQVFWLCAILPWIHCSCTTADANGSVIRQALVRYVPVPVLEVEYCNVIQSFTDHYHMWSAQSSKACFARVKGNVACSQWRWLKFCL